MSGASHTPGPWHVRNRIFVKAENGWTVASVSVPNGRVGSWEIDPQDNACLIAAAPELLEALEDLLGRDCPNRQYVSGHPAAKKARAAIAKARGQ